MLQLRRAQLAATHADLLIELPLFRCVQLSLGLAGRPRDRADDSADDSADPEPAIPQSADGVVADPESEGDGTLTTTP